MRRPFDRPGSLLRAIASRICRTPAMERLIDPVIADLQSECADALRRGQVWRSRWNRLVGSLAFWKVIGLYSFERAVPLAQEWAAADDHALGRTFRFSAFWIVIAVAGFVWMPIQYHIQRVGVADAARMTLYLIPQAIAVAMPLAVAIGTLCGLRGRVATMRTQRTLVVAAVLLSAVILVVAGWILPDANQAFRVLVQHGQVPRGMNELTLPELAAGGYWFQFHARWALSVSTLVLALFASKVSRCMHGSWPSIAFGMVGVGGYVLLWLTLQGPRARPLEAWTPNLILTFLTLLMARLKPDTTYLHR